MSLQNGEAKAGASTSLVEWGEKERDRKHGSFHTTESGMEHALDIPSTKAIRIKNNNIQGMEIRIRGLEGRPWLRIAEYVAEYVVGKSYGPRGLDAWYGLRKPRVWRAEVGLGGEERVSFSSPFFFCLPGWKGLVAVGDGTWRGRNVNIEIVLILVSFNVRTLSITDLMPCTLYRYQQRRSRNINVPSRNRPRRSTHGEEVAFPRSTLGFASFPDRTP